MNRSSLNSTPENPNSQNAYGGLDRWTSNSQSISSSLRSRQQLNYGNDQIRRPGFREFDNTPKDSTIIHHEPLRWKDASAQPPPMRRVYDNVIETPIPTPLQRSTSLIGNQARMFPNAPSSAYSEDEFRKNKRQSTIYERNIEVFQDGDSFEFMDRRETTNRLQVHIISCGRNRTYVRFNNDEMFDILRIGMIEKVESPKDRSNQSYSSSICDSVTVMFEDNKKMFIEDCTTEMFSEAMKRLGPYVEKRSNIALDNVMADYYGGGSTNNGNNRQQPPPIINNKTKNGSKKKKNVKTDGRTDGTGTGIKPKKESFWKRYLRR